MRKTMIPGRLSGRLHKISMMVGAVIFAIVCALPFGIGGGFIGGSGSAFAQTGSASQNGAVVLSGRLETAIDLTPFIRSYVDKSRHRSLREILALPDQSFAQSEHIPSFGYTQDIIWYRMTLSIDAPVSNQALFEFAPTYLDFIDVFLFAKGDDQPVWTVNLGDNIPASARPYKGGTHIAALPPLISGQYEMYIRVQSNSTNMMQLKLWPSNALITSLTYRNLTTNVFFGLVVTLGIAYFTFGLIARDYVVSLYGCWIVTVGAVVAIVNGLVLSEISPEIPWLNDFLLSETNILSHAAIAFLWLYITDIRKRHPLIFKLSCCYALFVLAFTLTGGGRYYTWFGTYVVPSHALFMAMMCLFLVKRLIEDIHSWLNWAYLVVLAIPTAAGITLQLVHSGWIDATPLRIGLHQYTLVLHLVGMGILMAVRLFHMNSERLSISRQASETTTLVEEQRKLISMLSHEFRTPLAVIQRSAEMLMLRLKGGTRDVMDRLERIQLQARKLARLVDIFLSKDGIDNQELSLARELVAINRFMEDFVANTTREGAEIFVTCHDTDGFEAFIDETLIGLAITNLIETSRRFAHGRPLHIQVVRHSSAMVEIAIPCSGPELNDDEIRLIGDALFRQNMEAKSLRSALGLHISQRIVDAHGGSIKLRDQGRLGIELCLLLPCEEAGAGEP
ncbi:7TM-DISM domain-containing protein [Thalassospira povalilytica]|uniref:sensor histidine kinase n=1 Tax=Thalassospira povalilytica TaxID=732237 RepID=UPI003AA7EA3A